MRVVFLSGNARPHDAVGNQLAHKLAFFIDRGADVGVFLSTRQPLHPAIAEHVEYVDGVGRNPRLDEALQDADIVWVDYADDFPLLGCLPLLRTGRAKVIIEYHGVTPADTWAGPEVRLLDGAASRRGLLWCADAILVHSQFAREELIAATGIPAERITIIDCAINEVVVPATLPPDPRQELPRSGGCPVLLFVGRVAGNKRLPVLIEALSLLDGDVQLAIVGDTTDVYAEETRRCRQIAEKLGVSQRVHWLGQLDDDALARAYRDADVFVIPSVHEGFCIPVVEAMAHGLPVVAARSSALPETVADAGLTFRSDDAADLARQVRRVLADEQKPEQGSGNRFPISVSPLLPASPVSRGRESDILQGILSPPHPDPRPRITGGEGAYQCKSGVYSPQVAEPVGPWRIAVVSFRHGPDIVGGAETSLRTIARTFQRAGHAVEIFTTCTRSESDWSNELRPGSFEVEGLTVHRFPIDAHDRGRHLETVQAIRDADGHVHADVEEDYLRHSLHSSALIEALGQRSRELDAIIVGPYLFGLTHDVACAFPEKTLLLPCFHDESFARLQNWCDAYTRVAGLLFHTPEEGQFAQARLGINHPHSVVIGTCLDVAGSKSDEPKGPGDYSSAARTERDLVYCGRLSAQKNVPLLIEYLQRYQAERPGRFRGVFLGTGEVRVPEVAGIVALGRVDEQRKRAVLAGAAALVQLSEFESLSLVVLEAWAQRTPVIVQGKCAVLRAQVERSHGGVAVDSYDSFASALDDLWNNPQDWQRLGLDGHAYWQREYGSARRFRDVLEGAIAGMCTPLREQMRRRGLARARRCMPAVWRERLGKFVEDVLDAERRQLRMELVIQPTQPSVQASAPMIDEVEVSAKQTRRHVLMSVRLHNRGSEVLVDEGPGRTMLHCRVQSEQLADTCLLEEATTLPGMIPPGQERAAVVSVPVPRRAGAYQIEVWAMQGDVEIMGSRVTLPFAVSAAGSATSVGGNRASAELPGLMFAGEVGRVLAEAHRLQQLPTDYVDVTEGRFARWKRWLKRKLLGNFKVGYVDVLSRRQTQVNQNLVRAVQHLAEYCQTLEHAVQRLQDQVDRQGAVEDLPVETSVSTRHQEASDVASR